MPIYRLRRLVTRAIDCAREQLSGAATAEPYFNTVRIRPLSTSDRGHLGHKSYPAKEYVEINIGMPRRRFHTKGVLIPQLALFVSFRRSLLVIIRNPAPLVNGGKFEY